MGLRLIHLSILLLFQEAIAVLAKKVKTRLDRFSVSEHFLIGL